MIYSIPRRSSAIYLYQCTTVFSYLPFNRLWRCLAIFSLFTLVLILQKNISAVWRISPVPSLAEMSSNLLTLPLTPKSTLHSVVARDFASYSICGRCTPIGCYTTSIFFHSVLFVSPPSQACRLRIDSVSYLICPGCNLPDRMNSCRPEDPAYRTIFITTLLCCCTYNFYSM